MSGQRRRSSSLENNNEPTEAERVAIGRRPRPVSLVRSMSGHVDNQLAGQIFDHFCGSSTLKSILRSFRYLCEILRVKPNQLPYFYPKLKANLLSWKAQALWTKLDKRGSQKCYNRGKACAGTRVLIIGAGPCGLRTAIEAQLLGAKVVVVEKRDRYSRNNVLHLWPYNIHDLRALGAKKFYGKFCAGSIDHISIRQLQCILLKVSLLLGVEVFEGVSFEELIEPPDQETGWKARVIPSDHPVSQYEFDVLIAADGKRNTLPGFKRKEFRGKLAIAITANFINKHSEAEGRVEEISGVAFIFNQKFFNDLNAAVGISLENIVYYKDETHYFVMTAKKQSLLNKGVLIKNHPDPLALLAPDNISQEALFQYAREAADFATKGQLPHLDFAVNHYGKPDVAMFDFTSMYAADHSARVIERHGHRLLQCLVGDSLLEPFWPTGTGCPRGFFSAMDAMWLMRQMESGKMSVLECLAERESVNRILSQTTPENSCKNFNLCTLDPNTRYPTLNLKLVLPFQITHLYDTDNPAHLQPQNVLQDSAPRKKRRKDSHVSPGTLLVWIQAQVEPYNLQVPEMNACFQNGLILCAIINRYRPDLVYWDSLDPDAKLDNIQLAFDILEQELGLQPVISPQETLDNAGSLDKLAVISYLAGVYQLFRREIPQTHHEAEERQMDDLDDSVYYHNHREKIGRESIRKKKQHASIPEDDGVTIGQLVANDAIRRNQCASESVTDELFEDGEEKGQEGEDGETRGEEKGKEDGRGRRVSNKKRLAKLMERALLQEQKHEVNLGKLEPMDIRREESFLKIQEIMAGERKKEDKKQKDKKPDDLGRAIGRLDSEDWAVKQMQERMKENKVKEGKKKEKVPKWSKEAFNDKLKKVKCTLEQGKELKKNHKIDASLSRLQKKLTEGSTMETGERGANKVSALVGELANKLDSGQKPPQLKRETSNVWTPPKNKSSRSSDNCHFCKQKVYVVERMSAEGKFFHRACFRCDYCNILLRLGSYVYHREGRFATQFFCLPHSTENALEKYKYKKKIDEIAAYKAGRRAEEAGKEKMDFKKTLSPTHRDRIMDIDRGATPERAEFEASIDLSDEEQIMDEDEWTDLNFGTSTNCANTSEDSLSDLEADLQTGLERPLTADETRKLAREFRARQGLKARVQDVRYTDQEYEDSSDCELPVAVPKVNRVRRRGRRVSSSDEGSTDDTDSYSDTDTEDEEIREIERRDNNPFNNLSIPKIVVEPNSPVIGRRGPHPQYVAQTVPLGGPTPPGTGLYKPLMSSLSKYQYKTPDYTLNNTKQAPAPNYRTTDGAVSNNLKKNWVSGPTNPNQAQKKVNQSEIDTRLKSLMDRLSNQQSLLKPADKPSVQMQHYLDKTSQSNPRTDSSSIWFKPALSPTAGVASAPSPGGPPTPSGGGPSTTSTAPTTTAPLEEKARPVASLAEPSLSDKDVGTQEESDDDSESTDSSDSESLTTGASDIEIKAGTRYEDVPEIKINLADTPQPPDHQTISPQHSTQSSKVEPSESNAPQPLAKHGEDKPSACDSEKDDPESTQESQPKESDLTSTDSPSQQSFDSDKPEPKSTLSSAGTKLASQGTELSSSDQKLANPDHELPSSDQKLASPGPKLASPGPKLASPTHKLASPVCSDPECDTEQPCDTPVASSQHTQDGTTDDAQDVLESAQDVQEGAQDVQEGAQDVQEGAQDFQEGAQDGDSPRRRPPQRRPSLLKTVVSIKSAEPVTVVNYKVTDNPVINQEVTDNTVINQDNTMDSSQAEDNPLDSIDFIDDGSTSPGSPDQPVQAVNIYIDRRTGTDFSVPELASGPDLLIVSSRARPSQPGENESSTDKIQNPAQPNNQNAQSSKSADIPVGSANEGTNAAIHSQAVEDDYGNPVPKPRPLLIQSQYSNIKQNQNQGEKDGTARGPAEQQQAVEQQQEDVDQQQQAVEQQQDDNQVWDIMKTKNSVEKAAALNLVTQKQSNFVHDLIMGKPRHRRVRAPRATISSSTVPLPPSESEDALESLSPPLSPLSSTSPSLLPSSTAAPMSPPAVSTSSSLTSISSTTTSSISPLGTPARSLGPPSPLETPTRSTGPPSPQGTPARSIGPPLVEEESIDSPESPSFKVPSLAPAAGGIESLGDFQMIDEPDTSSLSAHNTPKKVVRREDIARSTRDVSPRISASVSLPPTPITNPEKFGIKNIGLNQGKELVSPTSSQSSFDTDNLDGLVSGGSSLNSSPKKSLSSPHHKKGRGFMAAMTSIFRVGSQSPSPITSPDSSKASPVRKCKEAQGDPKGDQELIRKTAKLSLQASHPSTPPVSLTRTLDVNSQQPTSLDYNDSKVEGRSEADELVLKALQDSNLPQNLVERLCKRLSGRGVAAAHRSAMSRMRRVQEIQRELGVIEVQCAEIEQEGVVLEKKLADTADPNHTKLMALWYRLLGEKNRLVRREQELMVESKQLELIEMADREECELGRLAGALVEGEGGEGARQGGEGAPPVLLLEGEGATAVLDRLARIAEQREQLEDMLIRDKERYTKEDNQIINRMREQGISC